SEAGRGNLDGAAPFLRRRDRLRLGGLAGAGRTIPELLGKVEVRQDVEEAASGRLRQQPVVLVVQEIHALLLEPRGAPRRVDPSAAHPVTRAQPEVPVGAGEPLRELVLVSFPVIGFEAQPHGDLSAKLRFQGLDLREIAVELFFLHRQLRVALGERKKVERDVVGQADLREAQVDGAPDEVPGLSPGMAAAVRVDVIIGKAGQAGKSAGGTAFFQPVPDGRSAMTIPFAERAARMRSASAQSRLLRAAFLASICASISAGRTSGAAGRTPSTESARWTDSSAEAAPAA